MKRIAHEKQAPLRSLRLMTQACIGMIATCFLSGCLTKEVLDSYDEGIKRTERFLPTGPAYEKGDNIYIQGVTKKIIGYQDPYWKPATVLEEHPSYLVLVATNYHFGILEWIDPGTLPSDVLTSTPLPKKIVGIELFMPADFSPGLRAIFVKYVYPSGDNYYEIVFQSPEQAKKDKWKYYCQRLVVERRLPTSWSWPDRITFPFACAGAIVLDVATSPLQLLYFVGWCAAMSNFSI